MPHDSSRPFNMFKISNHIDEASTRCDPYSCVRVFVYHERNCSSHHICKRIMDVPAREGAAPKSRYHSHKRPLKTPYPRQQLESNPLKRRNVILSSSIHSPLRTRGPNPPIIVTRSPPRSCAPPAGPPSISAPPRKRVCPGGCR